MIYTKKVATKFVGRKLELETLHKIIEGDSPAIITVYGRRRIGKTALIEHAFKNLKVIKFEGIEGKTKSFQLEQSIDVIRKFFDDNKVSFFKPQNWIEFLELLYEYVKTNKTVIYFEELQWLANYDDEFIAAIKYVWDNKFSKLDRQIIILCGSAPSFMINNVVRSKSLYNRSQQEIHLKEFSIYETSEFLETGASETLDAQLLVGGIPEYLKWLKEYDSVLVSWAKHCFGTHGKLIGEYEKIFISSMSGHNNYKKIIKLLAKHKFLTREDLSKKLNTSSGGTLTNILRDLVLCQFIESYTPLHAKENARNLRYVISDQYLNSYHNFIEKNLKEINKGKFADEPLKAVLTSELDQYLGYAFERYLRKNDFRIARLLGFDGVKYQSGAFYNRNYKKGFQMDLAFDRADKVFTLCEVKYSKNPIDKNIVLEMEKKLKVIKQISTFQNRTIQKVLICSGQVSKSLVSLNYFDRIVELDDLFKV